MKNDIEIVDEMIWHDGVLLETRTICHHAEYNFILIVEVYTDNSTSGRQQKIIEFMGVEHFSQIMDATELIDNQSAGNIKDAIILYKKEKYKIMINLFGGFLSFSFRKLRVIGNEC
ncbi:hypothetical protein [Escherichia albertii]|uniref:hypothetical protein n=1 Tax=Escherichia albertii TaxID=208962 RepID=UPI001CF4A8BF|nr:hypothetical protein [Escherichia albertii]MCB2258762.1 hypothetical protein [Escherichia albertii]MCB2266040.1 hypothetical protein [Escherichia albertii]MCB2270763.1 hypothetical protein [Escherichia albertii]